MFRNMKSLLTSKQVAEMLGTTVGALAVMRHRGQGPAYIKQGHRKIRYRPEDVENWIRSGRVIPQVRT